MPHQLEREKGQVTFLGTQLEEPSQSLIIWVFDANDDLFAWSIADMPDLDLNYHYHKLSMCQDAKSVPQKNRKVGEERWMAIQEEVGKLIAENFIQEVHYTTWLANVVMVKKSNNKW